MNWLGQHWYTYVFAFLAFSCLISAATWAEKSNSAQTIWFLFVTCIWAGLSYWNWSI
jgi:hypothetical protein